MASHVFHQLYYHIVWSTKERQPLIPDANRDQIIQCVTTACLKRDITPLACNAMPDHMHLFLSLPPTTCIATFIGEIKGASAHAYNRKFGERCFLKWQDGYGIVTVRKAEADKVMCYVQNQQQLHESRKTSRLLEATEEIPMGAS